MRIVDLSFLKWSDNEEMQEFKNNVDSNFDKKELKEIYKRIVKISAILNDRINSINDDIDLVYTAYVSLEKEGNSKYICFDVGRCNKLSDMYNNVKYIATGYKKDSNIESVSIKYKKSDKNTIKEIEKFKDYILNTYDLDNREKFICEYKNLFSE